jgi:hypothetical protein
MMLPEDGGRMPKHVAVKTVYLFINMQCVCANIWFKIVGSYKKLGSQPARGQPAITPPLVPV